MLFLIVYLACLVAVVGLCALAAWSDMRRLLIPNLYPALIVVLFIPAWAASYWGEAGAFGALSAHLIAGAVMFVVTVAMFFGKLVGGGDSKLASALALWAGGAHIGLFLFYMAMVGVGLSLASLYMKKKKPVRDPHPESWAGRAQAGQAHIPYGVALFAGALAMFIGGGFFDPAMLQDFLAGH